MPKVAKIHLVMKLLLQKFYHYFCHCRLMEPELQNSFLKKSALHFSGILVVFVNFIARH